MTAGLQIVAVQGVGEIDESTDLVAEIAPLLGQLAWPDGTTGLTDGDIVSITSKIIAKAEGQTRQASDREQAITEQTARVIATRESDRGTTRIVATKHGFVMAAAGVPGLITPDMVKTGSAVLDVGITRTDAGLVGDVSPEVAEVAAYLAPMPGGVGPMTRAMLLKNVVESASEGLSE